MIVPTCHFPLACAHWLPISVLLAKVVATNALSRSERGENALVVSQPSAGPATGAAIGREKLRELLESILIDSCQNYQARKVQGAISYGRAHCTPGGVLCENVLVGHLA